MLVIEAVAIGPESIFLIVIVARHLLVGVELLDVGHRGLVGRRGVAGALWRSCKYVLVILFKRQMATYPSCFCAP